MPEIRFDGRVAIITGAGGGLGRSHALELARRGGYILVNDLGGALDGSGASPSAAQRVVDEISALGGKAAANHDSVASPKEARPSCRPRSRPSAGSTCWSTTQESCGTRLFTRWTTP